MIRLLANKDDRKNVTPWIWKTSTYTKNILKRRTGYTHFPYITCALNPGLYRAFCHQVEVRMFVYGDLYTVVYYPDDRNIYDHFEKLSASGISTVLKYKT